MNLFYMQMLSLTVGCKRSVSNGIESNGSKGKRKCLAKGVSDLKCNKMRTKRKLSSNGSQRAQRKALLHASQPQRIKTPEGVIITSLVFVKTTQEIETKFLDDD